MVGIMWHSVRRAWEQFVATRRARRLGGWFIATGLLAVAIAVVSSDGILGRIGFIEYIAGIYLISADM